MTVQAWEGAPATSSLPQLLNLPPSHCGMRAIRGTSASIRRHRCGTAYPEPPSELLGVEGGQTPQCTGLGHRCAASRHRETVVAQDPGPDPGCSLATLRVGCTSQVPASAISAEANPTPLISDTCRDGQAARPAARVPWFLSQRCFPSRVLPEVVQVPTGRGTPGMNGQLLRHQAQLPPVCPQLHSAPAKDRHGRRATPLLFQFIVAAASSQRLDLATRSSSSFFLMA